MSRLRFCLLLAVICSCSQLGLTADETVLIPVDKKSTTSTTSTTTATPDTTTSSTTTTTTPAPTTTTPAPTTTTPAPTTTTPAPTTTTPAPTTTTPAPTTTTPAPTPAPGPLPPPQLGTWNYTDTKTNVTCIVTQFSAQLNVTYTKVVENATSLQSVILNIPADAKVRGGNCTGDQWISLMWSRPNATTSNNLTIVYHKNDTTKNYAIKSFNISLAPDNFINGSSTGPIELYHGTEWETPLATSYRCKEPRRLNMTSDTTSTISQLTLFQVQEEAYRTASNSAFSAARECGGGDVPDAVPIAVGCALGGLVVVVLVAYLVGRRRSAARGYLSM